MTAYLAEELFESLAAHDVRVGLETGFAKGLLEELGHVKADAQKLALLLLLFRVRRDAWMWKKQTHGSVLVFEC